MPWIRFWHQGRCSSGLNQVDSDYVWYDKRPSDLLLDDEAHERVPEWQKFSEKGYKCGFEHVVSLPDDERERLVNHYKSQIAHANTMLSILERW